MGYALNLSALQQATRVRAQLKELLPQVGILSVPSCGAEMDQVRRCWTKAAFTHVARQENSATYCTLLERQQAKIHPTSVLFSQKPQPASIVYSEIVSTTKTSLRPCMAIEPAWLIELCPNYFAQVQEEQHA